MVWLNLETAGIVAVGERVMLLAVVQERGSGHLAWCLWEWNGQAIGELTHGPIPLREYPTVHTLRIDGGPVTFLESDVEVVLGARQIIRWGQEQMQLVPPSKRALSAALSWLRGRRMRKNWRGFGPRRN